VLGNTGYALVAVDVRGAAPGIVLLSLAPDRSSLRGVEVLVDLALVSVIPVAASGTAGQPGAGNATLPLPPNPGLAGIELFAQAVFGDPGVTARLSWTNGFAFRLR
jgi:hypothetical protein